MIEKLLNPDALDARTIRLLGNRVAFIPRDGTFVAMLGHMLNPEVAKDEQTRDVFWAPYGRRVRAKQVVTQVTRTLTFNTQTTGDLAVRALNAGDTLALAALGVGIGSVWAANGARTVGDVVLPTAPNGYVYRVTVAGAGGAAEPEWPTAAGETVADGAATLTAVEQGSDVDGGMFVVRQVDGTMEGAIVAIYDDAESETGFSEVDLFPAVQLRGTGKSQGSDGENETQLGWTIAILDPGNGYALPQAVAALPADAAIPGQVTLLNVPRGGTDAIVNAMRAQLAGA